jgi:peptide/nickel transport system ATP-binding protein
LQEIQHERGLALLMITHDLGVVARMANHVSVMYAGQVVESGPVQPLFAAPSHPYTRGLLACIPVPGHGQSGAPLGSIPGTVPRLAPGFTGCGFRDRCSRATPECAGAIPTQSPGQGHDYLCRLAPGWTKEAV